MICRIWALILCVWRMGLFSNGGFIQVALSLRHGCSLFGCDRFAVRRFYREGHVDAERGAQINFMLLLLHDDRAQGFAQCKFPHRLGLADGLTVTSTRGP